MKLSRKACAVVLRGVDTGNPQLLVLSFASKPHLPKRLPGGTLFDNEDPVIGLLRELSEETGLDGLTVTRKLGVRSYFKPYIQAKVERHDYLLKAPRGLPDSFSHTVTGHGGDSGEVFDYRWVGPEEIGSIDPEYQLAPDYVPELFGEPAPPVEPQGTGGNTSEPVAVVNYDATWPLMCDERALLESVFVGTAARIEHIGSTAVLA